MPKNNHAYTVKDAPLDPEDRDALRPDVEPPERSVAAVLNPVPAEEELQPPKMTMLRIVDQIYALALLREDVTEPDEIAAVDQQLASLVQNDRANKLDGCGWFCRKVDNDVIGLESEIERIEKRIGSLNRAKTRVRNLLLYACKKLDITSMRGRVTTISVMAGRESLDVYDEAKVPAQYFKTVTTRVRMDDAIRADLKLNIEVPGARMKPGEDYLRMP